MLEKIIAAAADSLALLCRQGLLRDFALIGGVAASHWGVPRATGDLDFVVAANLSDLEGISQQLKGSLTRGDPTDPLVASISFEQFSGAEGFPVQLLVLPPAWEALAFAGIVEEPFQDIKLRFVHWKPLLLLKLYAGGPVDLKDARAIWHVNQPNSEDRAWLAEQSLRLRVSKKFERFVWSLEKESD